MFSTIETSGRQRLAVVHAQKRAPARLASPRGKGVPLEQTSHFRERHRGEIHPILSGLKRTRFGSQQTEPLARINEPASEFLRVPIEARIARFHGLVRVQVQTPIHVEGVDFMPVALTERVREPAIRRSCSVKADEIEVLRQPHDRGGHFVRRRDAAFPLARRGNGLFGHEEPWIVRQLIERLAQPAKDVERPWNIVGCVREADRAGRLPLAAHQPYRYIVLLNASRLTNARLIEAYEIRTLRRQVTQDCFGVPQCIGEPIGQAEEGVLHASPPNTSTLENTQAGAA